MNEHSEKLLEQAEYLTEIERWNEAIPLLSKVLAQNPENFQANCLLALCHYSLKDYETALRFAEKAIAVAPDEEWGHRLRSVVLNAQGRKKEALQAAAEAVRVEPFEPFALQVLANAYLSNNKPRKAEEIARKMLEIAPESENSFFTLGNVYLEIGDNDGAEKCFREVLNINPNSADARNNLGVALLNQKQKKFSSLFEASKPAPLQRNEESEIYQHFSDAVKLEPNNLIAAQNLRNQLDYFTAIYDFLFFVPLALIAFFVSPKLTIFLCFIGLYYLFSLLTGIRENHVFLTPELKKFFKSAFGKSLPGRIREFRAFAAEIFRKAWKPYVLAVSAALICHLPEELSGSWNIPLAYILIIAAFIWIILITRKN